MKRLRVFALVAWGGLIVLCLLWEVWLAPSTYAPAALWTLIKLLPLAVLVPGLLGDRYRPYVIACLVALLYFSEGVMLAWSDDGLVRAFALAEVALVLAFFVPAALYVRRRREAEAAGA